MENDKQNKQMKEEIEFILTPPKPPHEATNHGGVIDWEYKFNKAGMKYLVDKIFDLFLQAEQKGRSKNKIKLWKKKI